MIFLRPYQTEAVGDVRTAFAQGRRSPLLVSPTGSGKTVLFSYIAQGAASKGNRINILSHRQELIRQISKTLDSFSVPHGIIAAGTTPHLEFSTQISSVQSLARRLDQVPIPDLIIADEAHHCTTKTYATIFARWPHVKRLGVTATPARLDGRGLGDLFDEMILGPTVSELIAGNFLARPVYYAPPSVDTGDLDIVGGDFNRAQMEHLMDRPKITGDAVEHYRKICDGVPAIAFCTSIKHAESVAAQFVAAGYRATTIDGEMTPEERIDRISGLGDGRYQILSSVDLIGEGVDVPIVTAAILLRPTQSLALHHQQVGRVLRIFPGKTRAYVIDHAGNTLRHGMVEEPQAWSLDSKRRGSQQNTPLSNRQCPRCYCYHASAPICPQCGHEYPIKSREISVVEGDLTELTAESLAKIRARQSIGIAKDRDALAGIARQRGHRPEWVEMILRGRAQKELAKRAEGMRQGKLAV